MSQTIEIPGFREELESIRTECSQKINELNVRACVGEEGLLADVLARYLGRLSVSDDFKKCTMEYRVGDQMQYRFLYDGKLLGIVKRELNLIAPGNIDTSGGGDCRMEFRVSFYPAG